MPEFLIVEHPERREVIIGGNSQGFNKDEVGEYKILRVNPGTHTIKLEGEQDYEPEEITENIQDTTSFEPLRVQFTPKA